MVEEFFRGGAQIGWVNATWPFASLRASRHELRLSCLGSYEFAPSQVVSLEPHGSIPFLSSGIRISHNRRDYPNKIIFWCMGSRTNTLSAIKAAGFLPAGIASPRAPGFPIRWSVAIGVVVLWNLLFLLERSAAPSPGGQPGPFVFSALLCVFVLALATSLSPRMQRIVLREGHEVGEIKAFLSLLQVISGVLSLVFGITWLTAAYGG